MSRILRKVKGFTLVELLVVIGIIAILAALLFPAIQGALTKAKLVKVMNNGRSIMQALMGKQLEKEAASLPSIWPASSLASSTIYWKEAYTNGYLEGFDFSFFCAPDVNPPGTANGGVTNPANFGTSNNAWCVAADTTDNDPSVMPMVFLRNVGKGGATPATMLVANDTLDIVTGLSSNTPFATKGTVVVTKGGAAKTMKKEEINQSAFNPGGQTLKILVP